MARESYEGGIPGPYWVYRRCDGYLHYVKGPEASTFAMLLAQLPFTYVVVFMTHSLDEAKAFVDNEANRTVVQRPHS